MFGTESGSILIDHGRTGQKRRTVYLKLSNVTDPYGALRSLSSATARGLSDGHDDVPRVGHDVGHDDRQGVRHQIFPRPPRPGR